MNKALSEREGMKVILKDGKVIKCANVEERYVDGIEFHETFLEEYIKLIC